MTLAGKKALITGASRGIGRAIALELAGRGAEVIVNYLRQERAAQQVAASIREAGGKVLTVQANVGSNKEIQRLVKETLDFTGGVLDILIHNAALGPFRKATELRDSHLDMALDVNAKALLRLVRLLLPAMEGRGARVLGLTSHGSSRVAPDYAAIGASKAALEALVRYLAVELAPQGIRVNVVNAGVVDTDALQAFPDSEAIRRRVEKKTPLGRLGTPEDIALCVAMLCGPEAAWITGQTVVADGGLGLL